MKVAVVQAGSVLFDQSATFEKLTKLTEEAAQAGAEVVLFPEAFLGGYPRGLNFGMVVGDRSAAGREQWLAYWQSALVVPGPLTEQVAHLAKQHQIYLLVGAVERSPAAGTLYCSLLYYGPDGRLLQKHRKLKPTAAERMIWGEGDGKDLQVVSTPWGAIGGLICWENYMPLARMALYQQHVKYYVAPTADQRPSWQATMQHIACEGRCYVLGANQYVTKAMYPDNYLEEIAELPEPVCRGGSVIVNPLGEVIAGPLWDQAGILYAELDSNQISKAKLDFDVVGHYARPDIFDYAWKQAGLK